MLGRGARFLVPSWTPVLAQMEELSPQSGRCHVRDIMRGLRLSCFRGTVECMSPGGGVGSQTMAFPDGLSSHGVLA